MAAWQTRLLSAGGIACLVLAIAWAALSWSAGRLTQAQHARQQADTARISAKNRLHDAKLAEAATRQAIAQFEALLSSGAIGQPGAVPTPLVQRLAPALPGLTLQATGSENLGKSDKRSDISRQLQHWQLSATVRHEEQFLQLLEAIHVPAALARVRSCQLALNAAQADLPDLHVRCHLEQLQLDVATRGERS